VNTNDGSVELPETLPVRPRRRAIMAGVLAVVLGIGIWVGRATTPKDESALRGRQIATQVVLGDLRDPIAALHRRIYAHMPQQVQPVLPSLGDLRDPIAALHRRIYAHFPEN